MNFEKPPCSKKKRDKLEMKRCERNISEVTTQSAAFTEFDFRTTFYCVLAYRVIIIFGQEIRIAFGFRF